jgi:hypothetical protein
MLWLVKRLRARFSGPMITICTNPVYRAELLQAGCDHESGKTRWPSEIIKILGL